MDKRPASISHNREHAFQVWFSNSRNDSETVRVLQKDGFNVTRQTIALWREKYCWVARADAIDYKKQEALNTALTFEETLVKDLEKQKKRYDAYLDALPVGEVDNQAMYVYNQLCEKLLNLSNKIKPKQKKERKGLDEKTTQEIKEQILGINR